MLRSKIHNAPITDPISCHFVEKNAIHHTHIALHIRYLSLDSGDGLGLLGRGGVEVLGTGDFRGRDGKDDLDVARVALVRVAKVPISVLVHLHFSLDILLKNAHSTVGTVSPPPGLGSLLNDNVLDDQLFNVEVLGIGVGLGVLEKTENELDRLLGPSTCSECKKLPKQ